MKKRLTVDKVLNISHIDYIGFDEMRYAAWRKGKCFVRRATLSHWVSKIKVEWLLNVLLKRCVSTCISVAIRVINCSWHFCMFIVRSAWLDVWRTLNSFWFIDWMSLRVWDNKWNYFLVLLRSTSAFNNYSVTVNM